MYQSALLTGFTETAYSWLIPGRDAAPQPWRALGGGTSPLALTQARRYFALVRGCRLDRDCGLLRLKGRCRLSYRLSCRFLPFRPTFPLFWVARPASAGYRGTCRSRRSCRRG